ncbi:retrovirus-related pol polyprotein from transposon TNT 1-94 [Tanacetum coccineum]
MNTRTIQPRPQQLHQEIKKTNKRVSFSTGVISTTSVSRPQLKSNQLEDRVLHNNSQVKSKEVGDHRRNFKFFKNKTFVTACNDSLNNKTSNVNFVYVTCGKCVLNDNNDLCVLHYNNGKPTAMPISTREHKQAVNQSVATPYKKIVSLESTIQKPRSTLRKLYEHLVEVILFIVDSRCSKHMTGNLKLLVNFMDKCLGTVWFGNDQFASILGYRDLVQGNVTIKRVYYVQGLNHNLFSVGQFCKADLEVTFLKSACYVRDLKGNDLLTGSRRSNLYSITLQDTTSPNPICLMAKASSSQAWLWHRRLSHLNFDTINLLSKNDIVNGLPKLKFIKDHLYSSCELGKAKRKSFQIKIPSSKRLLQLLHMDLCGLMRVESINGIEHQTSTARRPEQNGTIERWNRTLVEAARTMLSAAKIPLFFWAEAIATACFTQNRSLVIPRHEKIPYHIINGRKPTVKFFHIFGSLCYIVRDGENLDKIKEKGDACIFVGYSTQSKGYRVYNKRTRLIVETIHVNFGELPLMVSDHVSSDPAPQLPTSFNELDILFSLIFDEYFNGATSVVSKSSIVTTADALDKRHHSNTAPSTSTTIVADTTQLDIQTTPEPITQEPSVSLKILI